MMRAILLFACIVVASERPSQLVTVTQRPVRGYKDPEYDVYVFYNIPYATAPTGSVKFRPLYYHRNNHRISATLKEMWLNIITMGNPTPEGFKLPRWPPVVKNWSPHMSLGRAIELRGFLHKDRFLFWEEIYSKHNLPQRLP